MKKNGILILAHMSFAMLVVYVVLMCLVNFVPSIVGNLFFPTSVEYETYVDRIGLYGTACNAILFVVMYLCVLQWVRAEKICTWLQIVGVVVWAVVNFLVSVFSNMASNLQSTKNLVSGAISTMDQLYQSCLFRMEGVIRYVLLLAIILILCAYSGYALSGKK